MANMGSDQLTNAEILRKRNRELSILNDIAQALNREVDLSRALYTTLEKVADVFDLHTGWVWLIHPATGEPYLAAAKDLPSGLANYPHRMEGWCYCLETYVAGDLAGAANVNVVTCSRLKNLVDGTDGLRYHASIPLYAQNRKLGVLNVSSPDWRQLSAEDLRLLHTIGDLLSIAVERARLFERSLELGAAEERNRLAREIHDTLAQGLAAITLKLETADALLENNLDSEGARQMLNEVLRLARASLEEARRSVLDLRAAPLEGRSLLAALNALATGQTNADLEIVYEMPESLPPLPGRVEVGIYRITQEALANIRSHAGAHRARVGLVAQPAELILTIEDDGRGFDPETIPGGRFGLIGLNERARLLGGRMEIRSAPGKGTRIQVSIPV